MTYKKIIYLNSNILFVKFRHSNSNKYKFILIMSLYLINIISELVILTSILYYDKYFQYHSTLSWKPLTTLRVDWGLIWYLIYLLVVICLLRVVSIYTNIVPHERRFSTRVLSWFHVLLLFCMWMYNNHIQSSTSL